MSTQFVCVFAAGSVFAFSSYFFTLPLFFSALICVFAFYQRSDAFGDPKWSRENRIGKLKLRSNCCFGLAGTELENWARPCGRAGV